MFTPQARATLRRGITNENDENGTMTRVTRSKAAATHGEDTNGDIKKPLQSKRSTVTAQPLRKRAALGDVSNVTKVDIGESKKAATKGLVSKAGAPTGVQKNVTRTTSTRSVLGTKDMNKKTISKAVASTLVGGKRKMSSTTTTTLVKEETPLEDEQPSRKKIHLETEKRKYVQEVEIRKLDDEIIPADTVKKEFAEGVENLDLEDVNDPYMVSEYVVEIFEYLKKLEVSTRPNADYMDHQEDLEWSMRGILIDWLVEVHTRFHLLPETLFLAVNIIDRFLSSKVVQLDRLQLVGVTAMFIASKYEEILSPHVASFRHVADDGFSEAEILSAERYILGALDYDLSYPNPMNFLRRISKADNYDIQTRTLGKYLLEISLVDHRFMDYLPSHVSAAAMYMARAILERGEWVSLGVELPLCPD